MTDRDHGRTARVKGADSRRACAILTLHADGRQWYSHGQAGKDAAHEALKEDDTEPDRMRSHADERSSSGRGVEAPAYQLKSD